MNHALFVDQPDNTSEIEPQAPTHHPGQALETLHPLAVGSFHAYRVQRVQNLPFWSPCLIWVQSGTKVLRTDNQELEAGAGELLLIPAGIRCQLENHPDRRNGEYRALAFEVETADAENLGRELKLPPTAVATPTIRQCLPGNGLSLSLNWLQQSLLEPSTHAAIVRHRFLEVLMQWILHDPQIWLLLQPRNLGLTAQVQALVATTPDTPWTLERLAQRLHRSTATLRRQLRDEGSGLRQILDDVRLVRAFNLLQTTNASLDQIAEQCGYQSLPRFSERFRNYFGLTPAQLRKTREISRNAQPD